MDILLIMFNKIKIPIINRFTCSKKQLPSFINDLKSKNFIPIIDHANENKMEWEKNYYNIIDNFQKFKNSYFAVKLSSLNIENDYEKALQLSYDICKNAKLSNCKVLIDAENYRIQDSINNISNILCKKFNNDCVNVYKTYQMYRKDSFDLLKNDILKDRNYYLGIKLVRGAYYNQDKKFNILFNNINDTHKEYNKAILFLFNNMKENDLLMLATHNEFSINLSKELFKNEKIQYAQLLGMHDNLSKELSKEYNVFKYLPYGDFKETIPYLVRRLYENYSIIRHLLK